MLATSEVVALMKTLKPRFFEGAHYLWIAVLCESRQPPR